MMDQPLLGFMIKLFPVMVSILLRLGSTQPIALSKHLELMVENLVLVLNHTWRFLAATEFAHMALAPSFIDLKALDIVRTGVDIPQTPIDQHQRNKTGQDAIVIRSLGVVRLHFGRQWTRSTSRAQDLRGER